MKTLFQNSRFFRLAVSSVRQESPYEFMKSPDVYHTYRISNRTRTKNWPRQKRDQTDLDGTTQKGLMTFTAIPQNPPPHRRNRTVTTHFCFANRLQKRMQLVFSIPGWPFYRGAPKNVELPIVGRSVMPARMTDHLNYNACRCVLGVNYI